MKKTPTGVVALALCIAMIGGCATTSTPGFFPFGGSEKVAQHAAEVLIEGDNYPRARGREVVGWCWSDKATARLESVARGSIVGVAPGSGGS